MKAPRIRSQFVPIIRLKIASARPLLNSHISMPANFGARIQTGTVNGGFHSDIAGLTAPKHDEYGRRQPVKIDQEINGGGALIKAVTTNGGVTIKSTEGNIKY